MKADRKYFCDLDNALDCVSHEILSGKMFYYATCGVKVQWLESYLINRKQVKILPNQQKNLHPTGEQQNVVFSSGSILGHLLFILNINDLPHGINTYSKPALFYDEQVY